MGNHTTQLQPLAIWDHNRVTCQPTQVNTPRINPSQ